MPECPKAEKAIRDGDLGLAATEYEKCANAALERGDFRRAVDLFRAARAYGAKTAEAGQTADDLFKRGERERNDKLKPVAPQPNDPDEPREPAGVTDPTTVDPDTERKAARKDEREAVDPANSPAEAVRKLLDAASHHRNVAKYEHAVAEDPCAEAEDLAAASDDYAQAANIELEAGNADAAYRMMLESALLAEEAARCYEKCAEAHDAAGRRSEGLIAWSGADTCWERMWLFWDRMRRYWTTRYAHAWDHDDTDEMAHTRRARDNAAEKEGEGARRSAHARERIEADAG